MSDEITKAITTTLERNYADQKLKVESVSTTPVAGLYEIVVNGKQIAYTDATGQYMLVGDLIQTDIAKSLTEERKAVLNAVDFNKLPLDLAIKEAANAGIERATGLQRHTDFGLPERHGAKRLFAHAGA